MSNFIQRIKEQINSRENHSGQNYNKVRVDRDSLCELVRHFESMDSAFRVDNTPAQSVNRTQSLVLEIEAAVLNLGTVETIDIVMFTMAELRKREIKKERDEYIKRDHGCIEKRSNFMGITS